MALTPEPEDVADEDAFRDMVAAEIRSILEARGVPNGILRSALFDIAVFTKDAGTTRMKFLEVKTASATKGRVGFGGRGEGIQVDFLQMGPEILGGLGGSILWVLGNNLRGPGERRYVLFDSMTALKAAAGGIVSKEKQNNFNLGLLMRSAVTWDGLSGALQAFLLA